LRLGLCNPRAMLFEICINGQTEKAPVRHEKNRNLIPIPCSLAFYPNGVTAAVTGRVTSAGRTSSAGHT
jgi:hypothetical protein